MTNILLPLIKREEEFLLELGRIMMSKLDPKPLSIILYGSIARGDERPSSDLDLCLVYSDESRSVEPITSTGNLLWEWATRTYGNPVALRRASISEFCKRTQERDSLIQNIVREGVVISGLSIQEILDYYGNKKKHYGSPKRKIQGISK
ncbi:MAG: nucleotidyltransferase domain-containing protein [Deltaproteobacteria bacterium]|nr:nucleotidyltransferase domain-containing protein [Deltaproteobacteria bacterium]